MEFKTEERRCNGYVILHILEDIGTHSPLAPEWLKTHVSRLLDRGVISVGLRFTEDTYFYSTTLSVLVECANLLKSSGGVLAVVSPNDKILEVLKRTRLLAVIPAFADENDVGVTARALS